MAALTPTARDLATEETLTITGANLPDSLNPDVFYKDLKKLHCMKTGENQVRYSPADKLNYNEGKPANPFNKIAKMYGRHKNVFLFVALVFNAKQNDKFMSIIQEKYGEDKAGLERFLRRMDTYKKRVSAGMKDAKEFLPEELKECPAFFHGYHTDSPPNHKRNIHENLNINIATANKVVIKATSFFNMEIPSKEEGESELRRVKIYANGQRAMSILKEDGGKRRYVPTNTNVDMQMKFKWPAIDPNTGLELKCSATLEFNSGHISVKKGTIKHNGLKVENLNIVELAKQNETVFIRQRTFYEALHKRALRVKQKVEHALTSNAKNTEEKEPLSANEKLIPIKLPEEIKIVKEEEPVSKNSSEPSTSSEEAGNASNKVAKPKGREDIFYFNRILRDPAKHELVMQMAEEMAEKDEREKRRYLIRWKKYLERLEKGEEDAKEILGEDFDADYMEAFTQANHNPRPDCSGNMHSNFNLNFIAPGKGLDCTGCFTKVIPRMIPDRSRVARMRVYGNGQLVAYIERTRSEQRKYIFTRLGEFDMEIEWEAILKGDDESTKGKVKCFLVFNIKEGCITTAKKASVNGIPVGAWQLINLAKQNKEILFGERYLHKILEDMRLPSMDYSLKKAQRESFAESCTFTSKEKLTIKKLGTQDGAISDGLDSSFESLSQDIENLNFDKILCSDPKDELNFNAGIGTSPFCKLRKYWGRKKCLITFISVLENEEKRSLIENMVGEKCGENWKAKEKFVKDMEKFLKKGKMSGEDATEFCELLLDKESLEGSEIKAAFGGMHIPRSRQRKNIHANLNINLTKIPQNGLSFNMDEFFKRKIPQMEQEKSELIRVKLYIHGERVLTVFKNPKGQRDYQIKRDAKVDLDIEWVSKEPNYMDGVHHKGELFLNFKNGRRKVLQAQLDGEQVMSGIFKVSKGNQEVLLGGKTLHEILIEEKSFTKDLQESLATKPVVGLRDDTETTRQPQESDVGTGLKWDDFDFVVVYDDSSINDNPQGWVDDEDDTASADDMMGQW